MKKVIILFFVLLFNSIAFASVKDNIVNNLINTKNLNFNFEINWFFGEDKAWL